MRRFTIFDWKIARLKNWKIGLLIKEKLDFNVLEDCKIEKWSLIIGHWKLIIDLFDLGEKHFPKGKICVHPLFFCKKHSSQ